MSEQTAEERRDALVERVAAAIDVEADCGDCRTPASHTKEAAEAVLTLLESGDAGVYLVGGSDIQGTVAIVLGQLREARAEIARLKAGSAEDQGEADAVPTARQWIARFLAMDETMRVAVADCVIAEGRQAQIQTLAAMRTMDMLGASLGEAREAVRRLLPVAQYVSRGRGYVGVEPYPDAAARMALGYVHETGIKVDPDAR